MATHRRRWVQLVQQMRVRHIFPQTALEHAVQVLDRRLLEGLLTNHVLNAAANFAELPPHIVPDNHEFLVFLFAPHELARERRVLLIRHAPRARGGHRLAGHFAPHTTVKAFWARSKEGLTALQLQ